MKRTKLRSLVLELSEGILSSTVDFTLHTLFCSLQLSGGKTARDAWIICQKANKKLEEINYETFKNAFYELKRKGLVKYIEDKEKERARIEITELGQQRLANSIPQYFEKRPWDGKIYLITYDIPESRRTLRNKFRESILKKLSCGMLQASVWITPYSPRALIEAWAMEHGAVGMILISELEKDGSFGEFTVEYLLEEVYKLSEVDSRYKAFINKYEKQTTANQTDLNLDFISCVKADPQLPFELLPPDWASIKAYKIYKKLCSKNIFTFLENAFKKG
ncbi:hypothetical protein B5M47_02445 [candidate division CPR3 bacterium 4484_211]|uniref:Uncharacterized protein n=1 Tax=candidate division CPR3 bacterium 4484_211 TaxID=1968527 RepID=A0A1W9NXS0_UNCC3|nr:MAG: hypothetical protein B5M47_02445 [candidate division CPR3 bacterium 4484_211]